ncbi:hypothetical protein UFOVP641_18 [uncultured Caudovirales phage]|uniref:Uncharacterized protein n=1 Tax=uncultured Caudovirales phage TaxID=2100421 RepID=A0A6J5N4H6_9CAUD|nr:hypothetical protein UFOVP641_18 [uncultured Caudovirales phage]
MESKNQRSGPRLYGLHAQGKKRPHTWISGPDEYKHSMYWPWQLMKAQATFREEEFDLPFEEFYLLWKDHWYNRGRKADNMCLSRSNPNGPWNKENAEIITRQEHLRRQGFYRQHDPKTKTPRGPNKRKNK